MEQEQQQYQGAERRQSQSQSQYQGDERRQPRSIFEETTWIPGNDTPGMGTQQQKDEQAERTRQQQEKHHDEL